MKIRTKEFAQFFKIKDEPSNFDDAILTLQPHSTAACRIQWPWHQVL